MTNASSVLEAEHPKPGLWDHPEDRVGGRWVASGWGE